MHKISTVVYAQGFLEDYIENNTEPITVDPEDEGDVFYISGVKDQNEHRLQIRNMWKVLSDGLDQLRRENQSLQNKITLVQQAINTPT